MTAWIIGGTLMVIIIIATTVLSILDYKKNKDKYVFSRKRVQELENERLNTEPEIITTHAEVVDMICGVNTIGFKQPKLVKYFVIKFKSDDGEILNIPVPEESYEGFDIGLSGELSLIDGNINSFIPDDYNQNKENQTDNCD